jgi:sugar phosphate isomerase/epimerase
MIAVSSPVLSMLDFEMALGFVSQKFKAWEVVGEGLHFLPEIEETFLDAAPSYDMKFSAHGPLSDVNVGSLNPRLREAATREIVDGLNAAGRMGFEVYTVHPGFWSPIGMLDRDAVYKAVSNSLSEIDRASKEVGIKVALENMPDMAISMGKTPEDLFSMMEGTDLGMCFDVGHANTAGTIQDFLGYSDRFVNVHIHDNHGDWDEHLPVGEGNIDFRKVLRGLRNYKGRLVVESRSLMDAEISRERLTNMLGLSS